MKNGQINGNNQDNFPMSGGRGLMPQKKDPDKKTITNQMANGGENIGSRENYKIHDKE